MDRPNTAPAGVERLAALSLLAGAGPGELAAVAACMWEGSADTGQVLGREGEAGEEFWLVVEGTLVITTASAHGAHLLARAGPGSIVGELAILRHRPRSATVTVGEPCQYLAGGGDAMARLLAIDPVKLRLRRIASRRLAQDLRPIHVALADGSPVLLRPLLPSDRHGLDTALHGLSRSTLRRRFFSEAVPSTGLVDYLVDIDYVDHFAWALLDGHDHEGVAVARYVRPPGGRTAEVAFTVVDRLQGRGGGTFLLGALGVAATEAGVERMIAYVMEDNQAMRAVFAKAGATTRYDEPGVVMVTMDAERAAALVKPPSREAIAAAVHDVVTAASLALT